MIKKSTASFRVVLILAGLLSACSYFVSWSDVNKNSIGHPLDEIAGSWGEPEKVWKREDGLTVYKYHLKKLDPSCYHYWVVNDKKVIVDFYYEGYCRPVG